MRGHWVSQTRKLNRHYQNAAKQEDMIGGAVITNVAMCQQLNMPFLWRTDPLSGARKLKLGLSAFYNLNQRTGDITTSGASRTVLFNESLIDGLPANNKWVLFDFIPDFRSYIYYGDPETGSRAVVVDTSDESKFEIDTGKVKITHETLTFSGYAANAIDWSWLVPPRNAETRHVYGDLMDFTLSGLCVWVNKSELTFNSRYQRYSITRAKFKAAFDQVEFDVEFKRTKVSNARIHHDVNGVTLPFYSKNVQHFDFWNIVKTYDMLGTWQGWTLNQGKWSVRDIIGETPSWDYSWQTDSLTGEPVTNTNYYYTYKTPIRNVDDIRLVLPAAPNNYGYEYSFMNSFLDQYALIPSAIQVNTNAKMPYELNIPTATVNRMITDTGYDITSDKGWTMHRNTLSNYKNLCNPSQWTFLRVTTNYVFDERGQINSMQNYNDAYNIYIDNPQVSYE